MLDITLIDNEDITEIDKLTLPKNFRIIEIRLAKISNKGGNHLEQNVRNAAPLKPVLIVAAFLIAGFVGLFSETALNMALTELIQFFHINSATVQWLTTAYLLTLGILVPISGLLIRWFTTRKLFIASVSFSILGTIIAALSTTFAMLLVGRIVQAVGTSLLLPLMFNTILLIFPEHKRGAAMGTIGLVITFAPAIGPTVSGLIVENLTWHWIFWISLPFLVIALLFGIRFMQNVSEITKPRIDSLSIVLSTIGFGGIVYGFSSAGEDGWGSCIVISAILIGLIALVFFTIRQLTMDKPLLDLRVFRYPMFTTGLLLVFCGFMMILSTMILLPLYLKAGIGLAAFGAGLVLLPGGVINGLLSPLTGRLFDAFGPRMLAIPGCVLAVLMMIGFLFLDANTSIVVIILLHSGLMIGISMIMMPAQTNGLNQLPIQLYPDGTAVMNTLQQVSGATGTAIAITIMTAGQKSYMKTAPNVSPREISLALIHGIHEAFFFGLAIAIVALVLSFFIKRAHSGEIESK